MHEGHMGLGTIALDSDGLANVCDEAHVMMRWREEQYRSRISELNEQLVKARLEVACSSKYEQTPENGMTSDQGREIESCTAENTVSVVLFLFSLFCKNC